MAEVTAAFDKGNAIAATSKATASKTWVSGRMYNLYVISYIAAGNPVAPTAGGSTFTQVVSQQPDNTNTRLTHFRFKGDGSTQAFTIDFSGVTQTRIQYVVVESTGMLATGTNGADSIVQSNSTKGNSTTPTGSLSAFADATNNGTLIAAYNTDGDALTGAGGLSNVDAETSFFQLTVAFKVGELTSPSFTISGGGSQYATAEQEMANGVVVAALVSTVRASGQATFIVSMNLLEYAGPSRGTIQITRGVATAPITGPTGVLSNIALFRRRRRG